MNKKQTIIDFVNQIETYQSNHFGYYDRSELLIAHRNLPESIKYYLSPPKPILSKLWRGCDGISEHRAISFTTNKGYASTFGAYTIPFSELKSFTGLIATDKLLRLCNRIKMQSNVGDDEGEVIVLTPVWKDGIDVKKFRS